MFSSMSRFIRASPEISFLAASIKTTVFAPYYKDALQLQRHPSIVSFTGQ